VTCCRYRRFLLMLQDAAEHHKLYTRGKQISNYHVWMTGRRDLHCGENCTSYCYQKLADCSLQLNQASGNQTSENFHKRYGSEKTKLKENFLFSLLRPPLNLLLSLGVVWVRLLPYYSTDELDPQKTNWCLAKQIHSSCNENGTLPVKQILLQCSMAWH
jgi:hypothetical protein